MQHRPPITHETEIQENGSIKFSVEDEVEIDNDASPVKRRVDNASEEKDIQEDKEDIYGVKNTTQTRKKIVTGGGNDSCSKETIPSMHNSSKRWKDGTRICNLQYHEIPVSIVQKYPIIHMKKSNLQSGYTYVQLSKRSEGGFFVRVRF